jgi:uncharacterized integral membrane protein
MKVRTLFLLIVLLAISVFAALNWNAIMMPTTLSLGVAVVEAPLGLVMLGISAFLTAFFFVFLVYLQTSVLLEARRHARELQANRELADQAEASRFTELKGFLEAELRRQAGLHEELRDVLLARVDQLDRNLRSAVEQSSNTLSAYIGELEDRMEKRGQAPPPQTT